MKARIVGTPVTPEITLGNKWFAVRYKDSPDIIMPNIIMCLFPDSEMAEWWIKKNWPNDDGFNYVEIIEIEIVS